jgi:plastocyanin
MRPSTAVLSVAGATIAFPVGGNLYAPPSVRIGEGSQVTWNGPFSAHPLRSAKASEPYTADTGSSATHTFDTPGTYRFYCMIHGGTSADNVVSGMSGEVIVAPNQPPVAAFTPSAAVVDSGTRVTFDGSASHDAETAIDYAWDLDGKGSFDDGTGATAITAFASPGAHVVRLRVTDRNPGASGRASAIVAHSITVRAASGATDTRAPVARLLARRLAFRNGRVRVRLALDEPGLATAKLKTGRTVLARAARHVAGTTVLALRPTKAGRRRMRPGRMVHGKLIVRVRDAAGNARTWHRAVTVRRGSH